MRILHTKRFFLLAFCCFISTRAYSQEVNSPSQVLQRVGNYIITQTSDQIIDKSTSSIITNPDTTSINKNAVYKNAFNDWVYPNGVMLYGMMRAGEVDTAYNSFLNYGIKNFTVIFKNYTYFKKLYAAYKITSGSNCYKLYRMSSLDDCGAMGAALIEAYDLQGRTSANWLTTINAITNYISTGQIRLSDGTLYRVGPSSQTIWGDDLYMSVPCIVRMGKITGQQKYYDDAAKQVIQFYKRLLQTDLGITHHGYYADSVKPSKAYWGRANGWMMVAAVEAYKAIPATQGNRDSILSFIKAHINGVIKYQDSTTGLWHNLLDKSDSFLETSCTAMFTYSIARAINEGWLDTSYVVYARKGWNGMASKVTSDGQVKGTCQGTSMSEDLSYYYNRTAPDNDPHAFGPVLLAASEMVRLQKKLTVTGIKENLKPESILLEQNFPNPFNPSTTLTYHIYQPGHVNMVLYDSIGNQVSGLVNEYKVPGDYTYVLSGEKLQLSSGVYVVRLQSEKQVQTIKIALIK